VGRPRYQEGLQLLLQALSLLPPHLHVQLDVIGISSQELASPPGLHLPVHLHGYLSKSEPVQRNKYYNLLNQADLVINASPRWGGVSATVEAMHRRTAVLTAPYAEFQALFGNTVSFGSYLGELSPAGVATSIAALLQNSSILAQQQQDAGLAVEGFAWEGFVDRLFDELQALTLKPAPSRSTPSDIPGAIH
jgi:glycosyltransferase involved in cell wall biosynthesis